jgi:hypothetical protein
MGRQGHSGLLDRLLVPRIENYALNHDYADIDAMTDYLRSAYPEYKRQKLGPFQQQVSRAILVVEKRGVCKPEIKLQVGVRTSRHPSAAFFTVRAACTLPPPQPWAM